MQPVKMLVQCLENSGDFLYWAFDGRVVLLLFLILKGTLIAAGCIVITLSFPQTVDAQLYFPWLQAGSSSSSSSVSKSVMPRRTAELRPKANSASSSSSSSFNFSAFMADVHAAKKFEPSAVGSFSSSSFGRIKDPSRITGGSCPNRTFLSIFDDYLTCGDGGYVFPDLISGGCPVTACIIKNREKADVWGRALDF